MHSAASSQYKEHKQKKKKAKRGLSLCFFLTDAVTRGELMFVLAVNGFTDSASPADERAFAWVYHTLVPQFFFFFFANLARVLLLCSATADIRY